MNRRNTITVFILTVLVIFGTLAYFGVIKLPFFNNKKKVITAEKQAEELLLDEGEEIELVIPEEQEQEQEQEQEDDVEAYTPY
tara:strand:- start:1001 stop:1249 length:249 start_codon:yes stop_codon:yes gene_type:complete